VGASSPSLKFVLVKHNSKANNNGYFIFGVFFTKYTIRPSEKIMLIQCTYTMIFFLGDDLDLMRVFFGEGGGRFTKH